LYANKLSAILHYLLQAKGSGIVAETIVGDGQSATFATVLNQGDILRLVGPDMSINNGPSASLVSINSGGLMTVDYGRIDGTMINAGGEEYLNAGSSAFGTVIRGGVEHIASGASASNGYVEGGGVQYVSGSVFDMDVANGGTMVISEAGYSSGAIPVAGAGPDTTYMQEITVGAGGDLRIVAGIPDSITLQVGGTITIPSIPYNMSVALNYNASTSILEVQGSTTYPIHLGFGNPDVARFMVSANSAGETVVSVQAAPVCFCRGTLIATPDGSLPVEDIVVGTLVLTASGQEKPVVWKGSGSAPATGATRPVIVRRDAFESGMPMRDLRVTAGHSFLFGAVLIPVSELINGSSILWDEEARTIEYHHLELADHDILLAEGAPAESYRDDGNRGAFRVADGTSDRRSAKLPFAPIVTEGPVVDVVWRGLADRAGCVAPPLTQDADPHLIADGCRIDPVEIDGTLHRFRVDRPVRRLALNSRADIPAYLGYARDPRRLGVALRSCVVEALDERREFTFQSLMFTSGFNNPEQGFCWTRGLAPLPEGSHAGLISFDVILDVQMPAAYAV
jgi:autotransporter passenger strand-loop-strand repeat protein